MKNIKKLFLTVLFVFLFINVLVAGRYAGDFMLIGPGVRAVGMGSAFTAVSDDGSATFWNASGIAQMKRPNLEVMHAFLYENLAAYDFVSFAIPLPAKTTIGLSYTQLSIDEIPVYDEKWLVYNVDIRSSDVDLHLTGEPDDYFTSRDQVFKFAFAKNVTQIVNLGWDLFELPIEYYGGAVFKYIKRNLYDYVGTGTGFDISFMAETDFALLTDVEWLGKIKFGTNIQDLAGTAISWDTSSKHSDEVITGVRYGLAVDQPLDFINSKCIVAFDWGEIYDYKRHFGAEFIYNNLISVRSGIDDGQFTAGLGIRFKDYMLDYAFINNSELGATNRLGLRINL